MRKDLTIPKELSHLKTDDRGYPIPYFVSPAPDGQHEFRYIDRGRQLMIINRKVCHICGKKLPDDYCYFISGPIGLGNRISTDAGMHRVCAEFSLMACPHLYFFKAQRRENDDLGKLVGAMPSPVVKDKPNELYLIKASKFKTVTHAGDTFIRYTLHSHEKYIYIDNKLIKQ